MGLLDLFSDSEKKDLDDLQVQIHEAVKIAASKREAMEANNRLHNFPFSPGELYKGSDFNVQQVDVDVYQLFVEDPYSMLYGVVAASPSFGSPQPTGYHTRTHMVDATTLRRIIDGDSFPEYGLYRMTDKEKEELKGIEAEMDKWKIMQKINKFKALPTHIRQDIVDEAILRDLSFDIDKEEDISKFPDYKRFRELKEKRRPEIQFDSMHRVRHGGSDSFIFKYGPVLAKFSTEELMEAHAEASLEDEIAD